MTNTTTATSTARSLRRITSALALALGLVLLAGSAPASAGGPHTDSDMGGVGGAAGAPGDIDPYDDQLADSVGEWLDKWDTLDIDIVILRDIPGLPLRDEFGPRPGPDGPRGDDNDDDDDQSACEQDPDSPQCKSETCDALDGELDEAHEDWYDLTEEEREAIQEKRDWYQANCLGTPSA